MFCRNCGHEQNDGKFCDVCGKPLGEPAGVDSPPIVEKATAKKSKVPVIAAVSAAAVVALGVGAFALFGGGDSDSINTDNDSVGAAVDNSANGTAKAESTPDNVTETANTSAEENNKPAEEIVETAIDYTWIEAYIEAADEFDRYQKETTGRSSASATYRLCYIDDNDIPEIVMYGDTDFNRVCTYADGKVSIISEGASQRAGVYSGCAERTGEFMVMDYTGQDQFEYHVYKLDNGKVTKLYDAGCYNGEYKVNDDSADESEVTAVSKKYSTDWDNDPVIESKSELKKKLRAFDPDYVEEKIEVIPATELADMTLEEIKEMVGDDYRISDGDYLDSWGNKYMGITSDEYFPNVLINIAYNNFHSEDEYIEAFENTDGSGNLILTMFDGALIGDGTKVGDSYRDMMTKVDSLGGLNTNGVGSDYAVGESYIDGHRVRLSFDHLEELQKISSKNGFEIVDGYNTEAKCVMAVIDMSEYDDTNSLGTVTGDGVAIRVAPYSDATVLINAEKGDDIYLRSTEPFELNGEKWYLVSAYYYNGVRKHGYIHAEYVDVD